MANLGGNKDVFALDFSFLNFFGQSLPDFRLVSVDERGVNVSVANVQSVFHGFANFVGF